MKKMNLFRNETVRIVVSFLQPRFGFTFAVAFFAMVYLPIGSVKSEIDSNTNSLYGPDDKVVILNSTNIKGHIYGSSRAWLVEFFSSWCGHCVHFAPIWKSFAENVSGWSNAVAVAGIDCADENNIQTCREYEIMGYPTLVLFPPNATPTITSSEGKSVLNRGNKFKRSELIGEMRRELMTNLTVIYPKLFQPPSWSITDDKNQFWEDYRLEDQVKFVVLVYEGEKSSVGIELALQLSEFPKIKVFRFTKRNAMYKSMKLDGWPAAGFVDRDGKSGPFSLKKNFNLADALTKAVLNLADISLPEAPLQNTVKISQIETVPDVKIETEVGAKPVKVDMVSLEDLLHAVRNSLHNEIGLLKELKGSKLEAVKNYVGILHHLFPADRREIKLFFLKLENWLKPLDEIQDRAYFDKLTELEVEFHPWDIDTSIWVDCKGSTPGRRGYTCGLWRLFHTLTIMGMEKQMDLQVLGAIHGYVKEIFGCTDCSEHFTALVSRGNALMIKPIREQALWLWSAHNKVNTRIKGTASEDPSHPKQLYPSVRQCPKCFVGPGHYNEDKVADYLVYVYSNPQRMTKRVVRDLPLALIGVNDEQEGHHHSKSPSFFSLADIGIFMVVYVSVVILLVLGYIHFRMVSKRRIDSYLLCRSRRLCSSMV